MITTQVTGQTKGHKPIDYDHMITFNFNLKVIERNEAIPAKNPGGNRENTGFSG
jgi:hypothetical protein